MAIFEDDDPEDLVEVAPDLTTSDGVIVWLSRISAQPYALGVLAGSRAVVEHYEREHAPKDLAQKFPDTNGFPFLPAGRLPTYRWTALLGSNWHGDPSTDGSQLAVLWYTSTLLVDLRSELQRLLEEVNWSQSATEFRFEDQF